LRKALYPLFEVGERGFGALAQLGARVIGTDGGGKNGRSSRAGWCYSGG
jgi:hypothetical protein